MQNHKIQYGPRSTLESYRRLLRADFPSFIAKAFHTVDPGARLLFNWHIRRIAERLEAAGRGEVTRLIINLPPRSLKSICVSVAWPAWILGHNPAARILCASYAAPLALKHSIDCRNLMASPWYRKVFPGVRLARDQNEKHKYMTTQRGYRFATSVGGSLTGEGGGILIIDDPITPMQAESRLTREQVNDWFRHTFASRLDDKERGAIILVMQRLHAEDLSGFLLENGGWEHLCLPAIHPDGTLLHPDRENAAALERAKSELGARAFAAQYQQAPLPDEGALVRGEWFRRYAAQPDSPERIVQSWDTATKSGAEHDASACLTFAEAGGVMYLLDAHVARLEYPALRRAIVSQAEQWKPQAILIEDKASGQQLLQDLRGEGFLPLIAMQPHGDKAQRLAGVSAMIEAGRLHLPENAPWLAAFEAELLRFPRAPHDDQVDALTQYMAWARRAPVVAPRFRNL